MLSEASDFIETNSFKNLIIISFKINNLFYQINMMMKAVNII